MIVGGIGHRQVLGLAEDVVALEGEGELLTEKEFLYLCVHHIFVGLFGGIAVVPVVVAFSLEGYAGLVPGPVGGEAQLIVEGGGAGVPYGVPALVDTGTAGGAEFQVVGTIDQAQALDQGQTADGVQGDVGIIPGLVVPVGYQLIHECIVVSSAGIAAHIDPFAHVR